MVITLKSEVEDGKKMFSYKSLRSLQQFSVPGNLNAEQIVQVLHDKGVKVLEESLPS